ncbi:MAG: hypothetical protein ABI647_26000, partial [Gemmatimonadota bacterium]
ELKLKGSVPAAQAATTPGHTISGPDALDSDDVLGIQLERALASLGWVPSLPDEALVGKPTKVVVDDLGKDDPKEYGLLIKYESGVKLFTSYGETDLHQRQSGQPRSGTTDARSVLETVAGRQTAVNNGGVATLSRGDFEVPKTVCWNLRGYTYSMRSSSPDVSLAELKAAAASVD